MRAGGGSDERARAAAAREDEGALAATRETVTDAERKRAAIETYTRYEAALRRTAQRFSLCADDADDALQRALEILLRKAPTTNRRELVRWTQTVVRHEALAVRGERERILAGPAARSAEEPREDWVALLPAGGDGPAERAVRSEAIARGREALQALKPQELRALTLLAAGYSYAEIGEITGYSQTKVNRCLAEGRERFRGIVSRSEDGRRCAEMAALLSAYCDGEAGPEADSVREHLRACGSCRATLRAYRAAPAAVGALAPALPLHRSLLERGQDALANLAARFGGGEEAVLTQTVAGGSAGGAGIAAIAKVAAVCLGTAGGAAACVAGGVVPAPLGLAGGEPARPSVERPLQRLVDPLPAPAAEEGEAAAPEQGSPAPEKAEPAAPREPAPEPELEPQAEPVAAAAPPPVEGEGIEQAPPPPPAAPAPEPAPAPAASSPPSAGASAGSAAGEFGP